MTVTLADDVFLHLFVPIGFTSQPTLTICILSVLLLGKMRPCEASVPVLEPAFWTARTLRFLVFRQLSLLASPTSLPCFEFSPLPRPRIRRTASNLVQHLPCCPPPKTTFLRYPGSRDER